MLISNDTETMQLPLPLSHPQGLNGRKFLVEFQHVLEVDEFTHPQDLVRSGTTTPGSAASVAAAPTLASTTTASTTDNKLVHSLIEHQARLQPTAPAVRFETSPPLTYHQLNALANAVARRLVCGRGSIVPICTERSVAMVVCLLAVLKTGAAYVLVAPESPAERKRFIAEDTRAPFVLVDAESSSQQDQGQGGSSFGSGVREVQVESLLSDAAAAVAGAADATEEKKENLGIYQAPSDIAYVIYTSGTTGRPKGVLLSHKAAWTGLAAMPPLEADGNKKTLLCHSPAFSAAQRSVLGTLARGGTLCLARKEKITSGLADTIRELGLESLEITPSLLQVVGSPDDLPKTVKRILLGGEAAGPAVVEAWADKVELWSGYGLSECTQLNMRQRILAPGAGAKKESVVLLGRPTDSTSFMVLVPGTVLPAGVDVPGELCLGGEQLAEGYLNLPDKTAEAFIRNPFGPGRLYRTGDLVVLREDGTIELLGRADHQIKVDGHRVEPGEANAVIQTQPGVAQSAVVPASVLGRRVLVALVVPEKDEKKTWSALVSELREALKARIQGYAIPRYWVELDSPLPVGITGKTDVAALIRRVEQMDAGQLLVGVSSAAAAAAAAAGGNESVGAELDADVRAVVAQVLKLSPENVNAAATFQELGGSSLDAIVAASRLRSVGVHVPVSDILQDAPLRDIFADVTDNTKTPPNEPAGPPERFSLLSEGALAAVKVASVSSGKKKGKGEPDDALEDAYPVTPLQEGILADCLLSPALSSQYVYHRIYHLSGSPSATAPSLVRAALDATVQESAILRTTFMPWKRTFLQLVHRAVKIPFRTMKNQDLATALERLRRTPMRPLSDNGEPLVRAAVVVHGKGAAKNTDTDTFLVLEMHHALFDFWSSQFVFADLAARLRGQTPTPRAPFSEYVAFQQTVGRGDAARAFWREYLAGAPEETLLLSLGSGSGSSEEEDHSDQDKKNIVKTASLGDALTAISRAAGVTLATAVHQAWALTLSRLTSQDDVVFLTACSGRDAPVDGILSLAGPTLCTVPFRASLESSKSHGQHAKDTQRGLWEMAAHAHLGLREVLAESGLKAGGVGSMVNVLAKLEGVSSKGGGKDGDAPPPLVPVVEHGDNFTQYVTLEVDEARPEEAKLLVPFATDDGEAERVMDTFVEVVEALAAANAAVTLGEIFSSPSVPETEFTFAHAAFEACATASPERIAIRAKTKQLSYGEFNARADAFAKHLVVELGVLHGEMIPMYMEKSADTLVAIFGIMKAGAAFVPLDAHNPFERNRFIIGDIGAKRIVTDEANREGCEKFGLPMVFSADVQDGGDSQLLRPEGVPGFTPSSIAYAIYTSGSTGLPKGVLVPHSAVDASARGMIAATAVTQDWVALWVLNYIFDASYYDVFTIFSAGATLCVAAQDDILGDLAGHINDFGCEQVMLTPTITKLLRGGPKEVPRVKVLNVCGEKIDTNILAWAGTEGVDVYNGYGPTEATILMTVSKVEAGGSLNSIGFPMRHVEAVIVPAEGSSLEPVPDGEVGELCVRGPQLAVGYLNRPEQTSAAFVRDAEGVSLYRTGDLARWAEDGSLHCLGRKDYQVKLNGFRIELGEIENAILLTGQVEAVVVSVAEISEKRQLVAFCVFSGDGDQSSTAHFPLAASPDKLQKTQDVAASLTSIAHYMMPSLFLPFASFPTLPSGKANRKELVRLAEAMAKADMAAYLPSASAAQAGDFVPVSTPAEAVMREAWAAVLGEPQDVIGANSAFFGLGGDSIAAINVVAECRRLGHGISVGQVLANPTLAEQARCLKKLASASSSSAAKGASNTGGGPEKVEHRIPSVVTFALEDAGVDVEQDVEAIYPCGPGQIEFLTQGNANEHQFWNLTACRPIPADFDLERWKEVTRGLTAANDILRASYFQADEDDAESWYQIIYRSSALNWEEATYSTEAEKTRLTHALRDSAFEFGLPNIKYLLLSPLSSSSLDGAPRTLCIKVDHASYDGTLLRIFDDQFAALSNNQPLPTIEPFKNYIDHLSTSDGRDATADDLAFWRAELSSYTPPSFGSDLLLPSHPVADRLAFAPITAASAAVDALADKHAVTPSTVFQAAYAIVASRLLSGATNVLVDNLITGRNITSDLVARPQLLNGTCANFLPFRTNLSTSSSSETKTVAEYLRDTQAKFWDTTEHGSVSLGQIHKTLATDRATHGAKMLFCFQPFDAVPASPDGKVNHMRWVVMARSKVFMTINYALMVEVQKTAGGGYRLKLQWDSGAFGEDVAVEKDVPRMFEEVLAGMGRGEGATVAELL